MALQSSFKTGPQQAISAKPKRFRSLASKLITIGIGQVLLIAITAVVVFYAEGPREEGSPDERLDNATVERLEKLVDDKEALAFALEELHDDRIAISLYDDKHALIATNVDPPLQAPPERPHGEHERERPPEANGSNLPPLPPRDFHRRNWPRNFFMPFHPHGQRGLIAARGIHAGPPGLLGPLLTLVLGFVILVGGAIIVARSIVRPIERLTRTARTLGAGDLSARSRLDRRDEIGELGARVDEMAERIQGLLFTEKELLANVAHELRTPLARIGVALDLANEGDAEAARASLGEIAVDVSELETIVDDILTAMRFEIVGATGAKLPLRRAFVMPAEIAAASADRLHARHSQRRLDVTVADKLPEIHVDPMLLRRVVDNLIENAHKYTPDHEKALALTVSSEDGGVVFEVRDHGLGISAEDLPRVFTAFFRGDRSRSRETGGVGLGLTLAKRIVEAHGGVINVASVHGQGTTVRVWVPAAEAS